MVERLLAGALVAALAVEAVALADLATSGAVSRWLAPRVVELRREVAERAAAMQHEAEVRRAARWVVFEGIEAARDAAGRGEGATT